MSFRVLIVRIACVSGSFPRSINVEAATGGHPKTAGHLLKLCDCDPAAAVVG